MEAIRKVTEKYNDKEGYISGAKMVDALSVILAGIIGDIPEKAARESYIAFCNAILFIGTHDDEEDIEVKMGQQAMTLIKSVRAMYNEEERVLH